MFAMILAWAVFLGFSKNLPSDAFWVLFRMACFFFVGCVGALQPSENCRWIAKAMIAQFFVAQITSPGDADTWMSKLLATFIAFDLVLLFRYSMIYRFAGRPEPVLSQKAKIAILVLPIGVAVSAAAIQNIFGVSW